MKRPSIVSHALALTLVFAGACRRAESASPPGAPTPAAAPSVRAAVLPSAAPAAPPAVPARDPRWPQWLPLVEGVTVRLPTRDTFEGYAARSSLLVLVESRRACEAAGYTLSQTSVQRTRWENRFIFTATRGDALVRIELVGQPSRPAFTSFTATTGAFAQAMMRRRSR